MIWRMTESLYCDIFWNFLSIICIVIQSILNKYLPSFLFHSFQIFSFNDIFLRSKYWFCCIFLSLNKFQFLNFSPSSHTQHRESVKHFWLKMYLELQKSIENQFSNLSRELLPTILNNCFQEVHFKLESATNYNWK